MRFLACLLMGLLGCSGGYDSGMDSGESEGCLNGQMLVAGECVDAIEGCGAGNWGDMDVPWDAFFVDGGARPGGGGQEDAPLQRIQEAIDAASLLGGGTIVIAAGTYNESLVFDKDAGVMGVTGRCSELVTIVGGEDSLVPTVLVDGGATTEIALSGVRIAPRAGAGVTVDDGTLTLVDAVVTGALPTGVQAFGGSVTLSDVLIEATKSDGTGSSGRGLSVGGDAVLAASDLVVANSPYTGISLGSTAPATLERVQVTGPESPSGTSIGVYIAEGSELTASGLTVTGGHTFGVASQGSASLDETAVTGTLANVDGQGAGIYVYKTGWLECDRCTLTDDEGAGLWVQGAATLSDSTATDTHSTTATLGALRVDEGGRVDAVGVVLDNNDGAAVVLAGAGTSVTIVDSTITGTVAGSGFDGDAVRLEAGAVMQLSDCSVGTNAGWGVHTEGVGTRLASTRSTFDTNGSGGVAVLDGAEATLYQDVLVTNASYGVQVSGRGSSLTVSEPTVSGTTCTGEAAYGIWVAEGAVATLQDLVSSGNEGVGLAVSSDASAYCAGCTLSGNAFANAAASAGTLTLSDATGSDATADPVYGGGFGLWASASEVDVSSSSFVGNTTSAVWLQDATTGQIVDCDLAGGPGTHSDGFQVFGNALYVSGSPAASSMTLTSNTFRDSLVGLLLNGASATLSGSAWSNNDTDLVQQECAGVERLDSTDGASVAERCPATSVPVDESFVFPG